jgi:hypothetical protein
MRAIGMRLRPSARGGTARVGHLSGPVTGVKPRLTDRLRFAGRLLGMPASLVYRAVALFIGVVYWLGWRSSVPDVVLALVTAALAGLVAWTVWSARWLAGLRWERILLDLPRRHRRIPGPAPGVWATDVVPDDGRYGVMLLHFGRRGRPTPPTAPNAPYGPWGRHADVGPSRTRTIVAFESVEDETTAARALQRLTDTAANRGRIDS